MAYEIEKGPVFPYPLRPSSFAQIEGVFNAESSLELSETEKEVLVDFEGTLFDELKEIKKMGVSTHEVYVGALVSEEGARMLEVVYQNGNELKEWTKKKMEDSGLDISDKDLLSDTYEAVFQDIFGQGKIEGEHGIVFKKFANIIKEKTEKEEEIVREVSEGADKTENEVGELFSKLELKKIPSQWRKEIHDYSFEWARDTVRSQYKNSGGDVEKIDSLKTVCRLEDPNSNKERLEKLKDFKQKVKKQQLELGESGEKIDKAKVIVLDIYRKYTNIQIANDLLLWNMAGVDGKEILRPDARRTESVDKFIYGVGEEVDDQKNNLVLTKWMRDTVTEIEDPSVETFKEKYFVNSDEAFMIAEWLLSEYGFDEWKVTKRKTAVGSLGIMSKQKKVYIPKEMNRGMMDFLSTISHEIEGHVLSHNNSEALDINLKIMKNYSAGGRDSILEEAGAKYVEDKSWQWMTGIEKSPESVYFRGLELKKRGGSFRDCLNLFFDMKAKKIGKNKNEVMNNDLDFALVFNYAYDRAMRIFREHTPLDDTSGRISTSDQLKYLEQSKVTESLIRDGAQEVLYVNGFDLYSVKELLELGVLDKSKVKKPKMLVMNKLWPAIEKGLKEGKTVTEIMDGI